MFLKKAVIKNFSKFAEKCPCWNLIFGLQLYENENPTQVFSCEYCKHAQYSFCIEHLLAAASALPLVIKIKSYLTTEAATGGVL